MPQPQHITKLKQPDLETLDEDIQEYMRKCQEKLGLMPNVLLAFTQRPEKFRRFTRMYNEIMLADSGLSKCEREMIAVVVSSANRCYYCLVAHGAALRELSEDPQLGEMLVMNYKVADLEPRQKEMLDFAWMLTTDPRNADDAARERLRQVGFSDEDIFDICDVVGFFNYTNRLAHGVDMMPNSDYHNMAR
ncbi:MAG: alkylhydroperoxidase [Alphaproteobacteria bacterium]|nr:alkylhydroperoxidase [Alphaproteobacteria bacterium]